jgi:hypothetical protein
MTLRFGTDTGRFSGRGILSGVFKLLKNRFPDSSRWRQREESAGFV